MEYPVLPVVGSQHFNRLGGAYISGKPLPKEIRHEILALALQGFRPCDISRRLRITHGCISKLLSKYRKTGSIQPGGESVGRPRVITPRIAQRIMEYRKEQPGLFSWEIRDRLVQESLCSKESLPSRSSICRLLKTRKGLQEAADSGQRKSLFMITDILKFPSVQNPSISSFTSCRRLITDYERTDPLINGHYSLYDQRRERTKYTTHQISELEFQFENNRYPSSLVRRQLAKKIGVSESRIQVWFSNRRAKRRKSLVRDSE